MLYVIVDSEEQRVVILVKAENQDIVKERLRLSDTQKIIARLTDDEISVLNSSNFAVITA